ncbi:MAG: DUF3822 family protein [Bacteroidales bacterium]|nr:DUF3822 family protein [Bacteroidales bacterium]
MSGYSFKVWSDGDVRSSGWLGADRIFTTPEFQRRYEEVDISLLTPKCTLVPETFFRPESVRPMLSDVVALGEDDATGYVRIPELGAVLLFSNTIGESLSRVLSQTVLTASGAQVPVLPEMYYILKTLPECEDYNKVVASYMDGYLHLAIAQGKSLQLANVYPAPDFTTAEYFLFLALKRLQLNPEVSTVCFRTPLAPEAEMSLYRYFKAVVVL